MTKKKAIVLGIKEAGMRVIALVEIGVSRETSRLPIAHHMEELDATLLLVGGTKLTTIVHAIAPLHTIVITLLDEMGDTEIMMTVILPSFIVMVVLIGEVHLHVEIRMKGTTHLTEERNVTMVIVVMMDAESMMREGVVGTEIGALPEEEVTTLWIVVIMVVTDIGTVHPVVGGTVHHAMSLWRGHAYN